MDDADNKSLSRIDSECILARLSDSDDDSNALDQAGQESVGGMGDSCGASALDEYLAADSLDGAFLYVEDDDTGGDFLLDDDLQMMNWIVCHSRPLPTLICIHLAWIQILTLKH